MQRDCFISQVRQNLTAYLFLSDQRNPSLTSQGKLKIFFLISYNKFFICFNSIYLLHISPAHFSWFLPFRLFVIFLKYFNNRTPFVKGCERTPFDNSVYNTDGVIHTGLFFSITTRLAQLDNCSSAEQEAAGSSLGWANTEGL